MSGEIFFLISIILKFPGPPPFENPVYATVCVSIAIKVFLEGVMIEGLEMVC